MQKKWQKSGILIRKSGKLPKQRFLPKKVKKWSVFAFFLKTHENFNNFIEQ